MKAFLNEKDNYKLTPLYYAYRYNLTYVPILLSLGAYLNKDYSENLLLAETDFSLTQNLMKNRKILSYGFFLPSEETRRQQAEEQLAVAIHLDPIDRIRTLAQEPISEDFRIKLIMHVLYTHPYSEHFALLNALMDPIKKFAIQSKNKVSLLDIICSVWDSKMYHPGSNQAYSKVHLLEFIKKVGLVPMPPSTVIKELIKSRNEFHQEIRAFAKSSAAELDAKQITLRKIIGAVDI